MGSDRGDEALAGLGVELALYACHPVRGRADVEAAPLVSSVLVLERPLGIGGHPPRLRDPAELVERHRARGLDERGFGACERFGGGLLCGCEHMHDRLGDVAVAERARHVRHRLERTGAPEGPFRGSPGEPLPMSEPCGGREVAVGREDSAALELGEPAPALGLQDAAGALDLVNAIGESGVRQGQQVLGPKLVERRSQRAHGPDPTEQVFESL
jgi:hypothetical protein